MKIRSNNPLNYAINRAGTLSGIIICSRTYLDRDDETDTVLIQNQDFLVTVIDGKDLKTEIYNAFERQPYAVYDALLTDVKTRYTSGKTGAALEDFYLKKILLEDTIANGWYGSVEADWI